MLINESIASLFFSSSSCVFIIRSPRSSFSSSSSFVATVDAVVVVVASDYDDDSNDIRTVSGHRPHFSGGCHDTGSNVFEREQLECAQPEIPLAVSSSGSRAKITGTSLAVQHPMTQV